MDHTDSASSGALSETALRQLTLPPQDTPITDFDIVNSHGFRRLRFLWKAEPLNAGFLVAGMVGIVYLLILGTVAVWPIVSLFIVSPVHAQTERLGLISSAGRDPFDWLVAFFMGTVLLAAMCAALFSKEQKKISFGMDTTKTIVGFLIGFLSGGKGRI